MHVPVLLDEVIKLLDPQPGERFVDATFGSGGHSKELWKRLRPNGRLLAVDWNQEAIDLHCRQLSGIDCAVGNYADLSAILKANNYAKVNGLLLDLGVSSDELDNSGRGFSFRKDEPLLMTYSSDQKSVRDILAEKSEEELAQIIKDYSEERFAKKIAWAIKRELAEAPIKTTGDLVSIIRGAVPGNYERRRIHPATRTFMALRIYANQELENLQSVLDNLKSIIASGGRVAIISFHSLEDRLVKRAFRELKDTGKAELLNKKVIQPTLKEVRNNPRSRSAKLRVLKFL